MLAGEAGKMHFCTGDVTIKIQQNHTCQVHYYIALTSPKATDMLSICNSRIQE